MAISTVQARLCLTCASASRCCLISLSCAWRTSTRLAMLLLLLVLPLILLLLTLPMLPLLLLALLPLILLLLSC